MTLRRLKKCCVAVLLCAVLCCGTACAQSVQPELSTQPVDWAALRYDHSMKLEYAQNFSVDYYEGGYALIAITDGGRYLVVPSGKQRPTGLDANVTVLQQPLDDIYLVATSAMDLFCSLDALDAIRLSGTKADGWHIEKAKAAMEAGSIDYAGKYNAPDYERIVAAGCDLAIESTMIYHTPEVKEKLEQFGIPVLVERSSYETHPLGRTEWIKLYGVLLGKEELATTLLAQQTAQLAALPTTADKKKTVAFFYISTSGYANVRKPKDYVAHMIELAGGTYAFHALPGTENALSTVNLQMEEFYATAQNADILIYNSAIDGALDSLDELLEKSPLLKNFKAVKTGNVWCTTQDMFQETMSLGTVICDFHTVIAENGEPQDLTYLYQLR